MNDINNIASSGVLFDGRYKLLRPLSSDGGTADVWLALDTNTIDEIYDDVDDKVTPIEESGIKVAIKIYRPKNALDLGEQRFREEFKIVFNCHHSNLVQPINFSIYEGIPYLVLPYCRNGSSERLQGKINDKDELWRYISDVSAGLAYLHAFNPTIVHHDIKPANILVDDNSDFAITDFGISSHRGLNREGYDDSQSGTMAYMAPERFKEDYESIPESDIWSFGATLYELITGKVPFGENGGLKQLQSGQPTPQIDLDIPGDIKKLISDCLSLDISKRPSAEFINKSAQAKRYPPRKKVGLFIIIGLLTAFAILAASLLTRPETHDSVPTQPVISVEDTFKHASALIALNEADSLRAGLAILDSLGNKYYIPALYEQAFTYGWYDDSASIARKKLLGIELYTDGSAKQQCLPKSDYINRKAIGLLTQIEEAHNPDYPGINALALYKLANYYYNTDKVFNRNPERAEVLTEQALQWAVKSGDRDLIDKINRNLHTIKENKNKGNE